MKLKKFLADLNKLAKNHPEYLKYEVIYSIDDEGNSFLPVVWEASVCYYDSDCQTFETESYEYILYDYENAICIK